MDSALLLRAKAQEIRRPAAEAALELYHLADEYERRAIEIERTGRPSPGAPLLRERRTTFAA